MEFKIKNGLKSLTGGGTFMLHQFIQSFIPSASRHCMFGICWPSEIFVPQRLSPRQAWQPLLFDIKGWIDPMSHLQLSPPATGT